MAKKINKTTDRSIVYENNFNMKKICQLIIVALVSALSTFLIILMITKIPHKNSNSKKEARKIEFSTYENLYYYDPAYLIKDLSEDNLSYILVDIRSDEEYKAGHIKKSINVPLYSDYKNMEKTRIELLNFKKDIIKNNRTNKPIILYGYYAKSQIMIDGAIYLINSGIKTQLLSISWYEFKNNPFAWIPGNDMGISEIDKYLEGTMYQNN